MAGRILVLDDEENYAERLQDLLLEQNYRVDMATRPDRAIDQLEDIPYDLVISDYKMPVMDGADFLKQARELYPNLPVILVSGLMNTPELVKVANMGVTLVMEKPLDTEAFLGHVAKFSTPMTEAEKEALARELASGGDQAGETLESSYPEEPRFFSATSDAAKRFLHAFWNAANDEKYLFLKEPLGGDAELAVKDLSVWLGNQDLPVKSFGLKELMGIKPYRVASMLVEHDDTSSVAMIRIASEKELNLARLYCEEADWPEGSPHKLIFVYEAICSDASFKELVGDRCLTVPALALRPSDLAGYARRFARLACDRSAKTDCADLPDQAILAILSYDWPENYREVQTVLTEAVSAGEDEPISQESLCAATGFDLNTAIPPATRLTKLLQHFQTSMLMHELEEGNGDLAELVRTFQLEGSPATVEDLHSIPLVDSSFATLS